MTFRYEPMESDVQGVRRILESHGQFRPGEIAVAEELVLDRLEKGIRSEYFFVFADGPDGRLEGYACYGPITVTVSSYDLYWIGVDRKSAHAGLGGRILAEVLRLVCRAGGTRVFVETSSDPMYEAARRFYLKCGFVLHATIPDYYAPGDHELIFGRGTGGVGRGAEGGGRLEDQAHHG